MSGLQESKMEVRSLFAHDIFSESVGVNGLLLDDIAVRSRDSARG